jgi:hypothetical protein
VVDLVAPIVLIVVKYKGAAGSVESDQTGIEALMILFSLIGEMRRG